MIFVVSNIHSRNLQWLLQCCNAQRNKSKYTKMEEKDMAKCMSCGKTALLTTNFGNVVLCKNCGSLANVSAWSSRDFSSMEELVNQKNDAIQKATAGNISPTIIDEITRYFDEYINAGFITTINGKAGQTLKVFSSYCIVTTKNETKKTELENMFYQFDDDDDDDDEILSSDDKRNLVRGLMSGKLVQAGIGAAVSATLNQQEKEKSAERKSHERHKNIGRLISVGERRIDLRTISGIETFSQANTANGYLKFVKKGASPNTLYDCEYFFFNNSIPFESKKIKQRVEAIKNTLTERIAATEQEVQIAAIQKEQKKVEKQATQQKQTDAFEEIRKFKQLLDEGIISEEEFNTKKKQLLGL